MAKQPPVKKPVGLISRTESPAIPAIAVWGNYSISTGKASLIRYADDATFVFHSKADADKVMEVLLKRFGRFGLNLHPEKTRLIDFEQPKPDDKKAQVGCFDFLGFTHYWGRSWKGNWIVKRKTAKDRFARALKSIDV